MSKITIKDSATYRVELTKSVQVGRAIIHPGPNVRMSGKRLKVLQKDDAAAVKTFAEA
ncbi:MAG: hypothetical protein H6884_09815 [Rhodobiaceae bacterium]|nr:hypothetical protein [Rhodobiaceae bacterium]MCC0054343.1 hypothetical protein [Rhodobiaceae bacterium]